MDQVTRAFGLFQRFRPHGDGVAAVFDGIPHAAEYIDRLQSVYRAAYHDDWSGDAYFVVRYPQAASTAELASFGMEYVAGLRFLSGMLAKRGQPRLDQYLGRVTNAAVVPLAAARRMNDDDILVYEGVGEFMGELYDYEHPIIKLSEAYYSVACDYWLAWYLQWPYFTERIPKDVFLPYFELWARGHGCIFQGTSLYLVPA
jgi:hypothetical protein